MSLKEEASMEFEEEYRQKLMTADQAAQLVK
jgi:hypothetical protein